MKAVLFLCCAFSAAAHMGITLNSGGATFPREKATINDAFRYPASSVCHGTQPGASQITLATNTKIEAKTTFGAGHDGGHCAWFISADQNKWYKINDKLDCTKGGQNQPHDFTLPTNIPEVCKTDKCVLGWFWTPRSSGGCEIYSDCFDIKVTGTATGGIETSAQTVSIDAPLTCQRIDGGTGATSIYGSLMISNDGAIPANGGTGGTTTGTTTGSTTTTGTTTTTTGTTAGGTTTPSDTTIDANGCTSYTVKAGDSLSAIAARFDIADYNDIVKLNNIANPDVIDAGQVLKMPGDCTVSTTAPSTDGGSDDGDRTTADASSFSKLSSQTLFTLFLPLVAWAL